VSSGYDTPVTWAATPTPAPQSQLSRAGGVRIIWSEAMERALLKALVHEVSEGRQVDTGFKGVSWEAARVKVAALAPH
jgi:hypothetical protein